MTRDDESRGQDVKGTTKKVAATLAVLLLLAGCGGDEERGGTPLPEASASAPAAPGDEELEEAAEEPLDHEDDYTAPVEELVGHADHLDLDRLEPEKRAELETILAERDELKTSLWEAYGPGLGGENEIPAEWGTLDLGELTYALLSARAVQLADAAAEAGSLEAAKEAGKVGPEHPEVTARETGECVSVEAEFDEFGRSFNAVAGEAGATLQETLETRVRVGAEEGCDGEVPAFSPKATEALAALETGR